jgi:hypothetical protein
MIAGLRGDTRQRCGGRAPRTVCSFGAKSAQTRAPLAGIVDLEGGGSVPTLVGGGGARARVPEERRVREEGRLR